MLDSVVDNAVGSLSEVINEKLFRLEAEDMNKNCTFSTNYNLESNSEEFVRLCILLCDNARLGLTKREAEIIAMLLQQRSVAQIANYLSREEKTIHKHLQNIKRKMSCPTLFALGVKISGHLSQLQQIS